MQSRLNLPNYVNHVRALGYSDADLTSNGSDRLIDDLVAWGDSDTAAARIAEHLAAGADHVAIHPLGNANDPLGLTQLELLADVLDLS